jgi:hypothetical protein
LDPSSLLVLVHRDCWHHPDLTEWAEALQRKSEVAFPEEPWQTSVMGQLADILGVLGYIFAAHSSLAKHSYY